jgi:predicted PurR-regulated permease PerM
MWGFLIGLYLAMIIYPFLEEWQQQQADKKLLAKMRERHATGRRWDVSKGEWIDE